MKKLIKLIAIITCALLAVIPLGCGGNSDLNSENTVQLYYWKSGYGLDFLDRIVKEYNAKQSQYKVELEYTGNAATILSTLDQGESNTYDLYFTMVQNDNQLASATDLSDVLDSNATGENVTIRSKYDPMLLQSQKNTDGKISTLTYGSGYVGIVYNVDVLNGRELPKTTDELDMLTAELQSDSRIEAPWLFFNNATDGGYWNYLATVWAAQYEGADYYYNNLLQLKGVDPAMSQKDVLKQQDGRYKALEALEGIITPNTVHSAVVETDQTKCQSEFLRGEAAFIVNGNWLLNENKSNANVAMMKTPVISSIIEKLDTVDSDSVLSALIEAIDNGATSYAGVSESDFYRVKEARNLMFNNSSMLHVFIPEYSPAKAAAKDFLRYYYSDFGTLAFMETLKLPSTVKLTDESKFSTAGLSNWSKTQFELAKSVTPLVNLRNKALYYKNTGLDGFCGVNYPQRLCAKNAADQKNAAECWNEITARIETNWNTWVS